MVNVSPYNPVQKQIRDLIEIYITNLMNAISQYDKYDINRFIKHPELKRIFKIYNESKLFNTRINSYKENTIRDELPFEKLKDLLFNEISKFTVVIVNSTKKGDQRFNYNMYKDTGARVIAVGGFILSRGLTLSGLMVSY